MDSGDGQGALEAYDEALDLAKRAGDHAWIDQLRGERQYCRFEHGLPPDEDDRLAEGAIPAYPKATHYSVAWFPREQIRAALARWPSLAEDLCDPDVYCRTIEARLRDVLKGDRPPAIRCAPRVERLVEFAAENGIDPESGAARSRFAAELGRIGESVAWPPNRNEPCWCGSGRKYKRCCG